MPYVSLNPSTNQVLLTHTSWDSARLAAALTQAHTAQQTWAQTPMPRRAEVVREVAAHLRAQADSYAALITQEMGKLLREARAEVEKCASGCDFYAQHAEEFLRDDLIKSNSISISKGTLPKGRDSSRPDLFRSWQKGAINRAPTILHY